VRRSKQARSDGWNRLPVEAEAIPEELRQRTQWVNWKLEPRPGETKVTKVPYSPRSGKRASSTRAATWTGFDVALREYASRKEYSGIGFVFSPADEYTGIDLDKCIDPETGEVLDWGRRFIDLLNSYTEVSPSGTGVKVWVRGKPPGAKHKQTGFGPDGEGAVEVYDRARFFTMTGRRLAECPDQVQDRQPELERFYSEVFGDGQRETRKARWEASAEPVELEDAELLQKARAAKNGAEFERLWRGDTGGYNGDDSRADLALCRHLAFWTGGDERRIDRLFRQSGLMREKWEREDYRQRTLAKALEGMTEFYNPGRAAHGKAEEARPDPEALFERAKAAAETERDGALRELAAVLTGDPLGADRYGERLKKGGLANKGAFAALVKELGKQQRAAARKRKRTVDAQPVGAEGERDSAVALPEIDAGDRDLPRVTGAAWSALLAANEPPTLFRQGGVATRIEMDDAGAPATRTLNEDRMRHSLARAANWYYEDEDGMRTPAAPPALVVKDVLATPDMPLPVLTRIVEAPVFAPDGTVQTEPGYHSASQTYYAPAAGFEVRALTVCPSADEVSLARELLVTELLGDFPFVSDAERSHAVALLLLPFVRALISGATPLHLVEKPSPGTGASLLCDALTFPSTGHTIAAMTEGRDEDEWRKRITAKLRNGGAVVLIDNLRRRLDSAAVSSVITATVWEDRLLGVSETVRIPVRCAWVATGNNPTLSSELTRRTVRIRLDAKRDRPWLRSGFRHADLRGWAAENRGELVWAALTLGQAWLAAGRPTPAKPLLGMFEAWSGVMGGILQVAGVRGFLTNLDEFYQETDTEGATWRGFVLGWWDTFGPKEVGVAELWSVAGTVEPPLELGDGGEKSQRTRLGRQLGFMRDRQFGLEVHGEELHLRIVAGSTVHRAQQWRLVPVQQVATAGERVNVCERLPSAVGLVEESDDTSLLRLTPPGGVENVHGGSPPSPDGMLGNAKVLEYSIQQASGLLA